MAQSDELEILRETPDWVAIAKPAGLATIPGRAETDSVLERLGRHLGLPSSGTDDPRIRVVHRLDKDTSGVLLFATHTDAQRHLSHQFQNNAVEKEYVALVRGRPAAAEGEVDAPLARHPTSPLRMAIVRHGGRPARTLWRGGGNVRGPAPLRGVPENRKNHPNPRHPPPLRPPPADDPPC